MIDLSFLTPLNLILWTGLWDLFGFALMGYDKHLAVSQEHGRHQDRVSERTLHEIALVGGFIGIIAGARMFHHKVSKASFWGPVVAAILIWGVLGYLLLTGAIPRSV